LVQKHMMTTHISLAPFQGITNKNYRNIFTHHFPGYDEVYTPFISGVGYEKINPSKFRDMVPIEENMVSTVPQFVSTDAREVIQIAKHLKDYGYHHINWNMGCPFSRLANKKRGCGMLPFPDDIRTLLDEIMPQISVQLSIKTRLGYKSPEELSKVIPVFNQYPLKEIIIHPRIGTQLYRGEVNLDVFSEALLMSKHPVTYNGDIWHSERFRELKIRFPRVDSWMAGRGALINPFLASQMKNITIDDADKRIMVQNFHQDIFHDYLHKVAPKRVFLGSLKSLWYYMNGMFKDGKYYFDQIKICNETDAYLQLVDQLIKQPFASEEELEIYFKNGLKHI
jgi:tRNA-dihydrouridine synthase B